MNSKKGISLIVLVITIIVIIILAAAVVMSLSNNNVLTNSRTAVNESDFSEIQSSFQIKMQAILVKQLDSVVISGYIDKSGFVGRGYAGTEPTGTVYHEGDTGATASNLTPSTISQSVQDDIKDLKISSLDLSDSKFSYVAIANNKVVAIVKNGQLMVKLNKTPTNGVTDAEDGKLSVINANFDFTNTTHKGQLTSTYTGSTGWTQGVEIK